MPNRIGVREFRDNFTTIVREATEPVVVTSHDSVVGWFMPAKRAPKTVREALATLEAVRRRAEARGVDVGGRLAALGLEEDAPARPRKARSPRKRS